MSSYMKISIHKYKTLFLMVSAMHDYIVKLEQEALRNNRSEIASKLSAARLKLLELKVSSEKMMPNRNVVELRKAA
jgi:hypothetical protein